MDRVEKQLNEFKQLLDQAIEKFNGHDEEIKQIRSTVEELEQGFAEMHAQGRLYGDEIGFQDSKTAKQFVEFCQAVFNSSPAVKDMSEGLDPDGGYLTPEEFRNTLIRLMETFGVARRGATVIPMNREELTMPKLTQGVSTYWIGENQTISQSQPRFGQVRLVARKLAALVPVSNELLEDAVMSIANLLATLFAEAMAEEEDRVAFVGSIDDGDPFNGVINDPDVTTITMDTGDTSFANVNADYLADMISQLKPAAQRGARFYVHRTVFNYLRKLYSSNVGYLFQMPAGNEPGTIWGYPYEVIESLPGISDDAADTPFLFFGSLRHLYLGDRRRMSIAQSQHVGFAEDQVFLRAVQREGMNVAVPNGFAVLKTAAS